MFVYVAVAAISVPTFLTGLVFPSELSSPTFFRAINLADIFEFDFLLAIGHDVIFLMFSLAWGYHEFSFCVSTLGTLMTPTSIYGWIYVDVNVD